MAKFNEILVGRYNRALQKLFGLKGDAPAPQLASEISPAFGLLNGVENRYLENWNRFGLYASVGPVAAQVGAFRLRNPVGSNVIAVVEKVLVFNGNAAGQAITTELAATNIDLTPVAMQFIRMDPRGGPNASLTPSQGNGAALTISGGQRKAAIQLLPTVSFDFIGTHNQEIPILPGDAFQVIAAAVNQSVDATIQWRERYLEESERT